mmetsp:Transcript_34517/g.88550  ORF Transcript_34517/g.88550 Transcript_34517/m.88550 type:complete len:93 (+) Transcript_34517:60-338(+)
MAESAPEGDVPLVQDKEERSGLRDCGESVLDCFAFLGRGAVATGRGAHQVAQRTAYPVKEAVIGTVDSTSNYLTPYLAKRPADNRTPTFRYG